MLVSHTHKFIVINIPKTGCTSIINCLLQNIKPDIIGSSDPKGYYQHGTAVSIRKKLSKDGFDWNGYTSYTRVRNPWARYVSYCLWLVEHIKEFPLAENHFKNNNYNFKKFLEYYIRNKIEPQHLFFLDNDEVIVKHIDKFENLQDHFIKICHNHNLPEHELLHLNKNQNYSYRNFYNQETIDLVSKKESYVINKYKYQY